ncbi:uncharacterized protein LOC135225280 [Macrobrachium nipponense]|uniref:uncharacterized protein LOC135225280 n=1 Tax=Macrobrachium nipponense TaxID=159736 RepID=UPI0030C7A438
MERIFGLVFHLFITSHSFGVIAMSTPSLTRVSPGDSGGQQVEAAGSTHLPQQETAASGSDDNGFMEDIGFSHFFTDVGLQSSASNLEVGGAGEHRGFSLPHDFTAAGLGSGHLTPGPHLGGDHLGAGIGLGFSASTKQEQNTDAKVDPAIQGFIPADPLSFGGHISSSSSFVDTKAPPFVITHPSPVSQPIYRPSTHSPYASGHLQTSDSKQKTHSKYPQGRYRGDTESRQTPSSNQKHPRYGGSHSASSHSNSNLGPSHPPTYEDPRSAKYEEESPKESNTKGFENSRNEGYHSEASGDDGYYSGKDESYNPGPRKRTDHGHNNPHRESYHAPGYDFHAHYHDDDDDDDDDEYSYAPVHQEESRHEPHGDYPEHGSSTRQRPYKHDHHGGNSQHHGGPREHYKNENRYQDENPKYNRPNRPQQHERDRSESRPEEHYENQGSGKSGYDGPCRIEEKDGMTCKICKDEEGAFSEHCSHSKRNGKDRVYANSRRGSHNRKGPDVGKNSHSSSQTRSNPVYEDRSGHSHGKPPNPYQENSYRPYRIYDYDGDYSTLVPESVPYAVDRMGVVHADDFAQDLYFDAFAEGSSFDPYIVETPYDGFDEASLDFGHEEHGHPFTAFGDDDDVEHGHSHGHAAAAQRRADYVEPNKSEAEVIERKQEYPGVIHDHFYPLDHEDNYAELTRMVSQFKKKDRSSCKQVQREGMSCFVCQDPYGMEDEECMYAARDPNGHDIKYSEEVSYGSGT